MQSETRYRAYLVRMWVTRRDGSLTCRIVLVDPHTGEERAFADLESLVCYLRATVETAPTAPPD